LASQSQIFPGFSYLTNWLRSFFHYHTNSTELKGAENHYGQKTDTLTVVILLETYIKLQT